MARNSLDPSRKEAQASGMDGSGAREAGLDGTERWPWQQGELLLLMYLARETEIESARETEGGERRARERDEAGPGRRGRRGEVQVAGCADGDDSMEGGANGRSSLSFPHPASTEALWWLRTEELGQVVGWGSMDWKVVVGPIWKTRKVAASVGGSDREGIPRGRFGWRRDKLPRNMEIGRAS